MNEGTIQLRDKGVITLPISLRRKYSLRSGDVFSLVELGEGAVRADTPVVQGGRAGR